jgi:hypothetical protein
VRGPAPLHQEREVQPRGAAADNVDSHSSEIAVSSQLSAFSRRQAPSGPMAGVTEIPSFALS